MTVCGLAGTDAHGRTLMRLLTELGADVAGVATLDDRPTTTKTRLVGLAQHRHRQQLMRVDEEDTSAMPDHAIRDISDRARRLVVQADVVCIEDYDKGVVCDEITRAVIAAARQHDKPVLVDPARLDDYERYRSATAITPNREELSIAVGRRLKTIDDVGAAAASLVDRFALEAVVATVDRGRGSGRRAGRSASSHTDHAAGRV